MNGLSGLSGLSGLGMGQIAASWWMAAGVVPLAAYQAKGAANLAASYVNLANSGTYDLALGVAPTFDAVNGWTFNGSTQYLDTGIVPPTTQTWSWLVQYSGILNNNAVILGTMNILDNVEAGLMPKTGINALQYWNGNMGGHLETAPALLSGNIGVAGNAGFRNGVMEAGAIVNFSPGKTLSSMYIGACNYGAFGVSNYTSGSVQALAIYATILTAPQVALQVAAMAAL